MADMQQQDLLSLVQDCLAKHMYSSAAFFADKLVVLSGCEAAHVYLLAQAYFMGQQYRRALMLLRSTELMDEDAQARYLAARCLAEVHDWEECLNVLGDGGDAQGSDTARGSQDTLGQPADAAISEVLGQKISLHAAMCLLRGKVHSILDNQIRAVEWLRRALIADCYCYEAFQILVERHMLSEAEEDKLISAMSFPSEGHWLQLLYRAKCKKYGQADMLDATLQQLEQPLDLAEAPVNGATGLDQAMDAQPAPAAGQQSGLAGASPGAAGGADVVRGCGLAGDLDVAACRADWLLHMGAFEDCYELSCTILKQDAFALEIMPAHLASAVELQKKNELFLRSHRLTEEYPDKAVAWHGVGCYYLASGQYEQARRYFGKATTLDPTFAPSWLGFGHAFAAMDESDQAMAAYRTAARRFPGMHHPMIGMGMEYARMNNNLLAEQILQAAHDICPDDPILLHELGVMAFRGNELDHAESWLTRAMDAFASSSPAEREPTLCCLGHVYRKQKRWREAVEAFEEAQGLAPGQPGTYAALAFTQHLQGELTEAITNYHRALSLRPDDTFSSDMLAAALQEECRLDKDYSDDLMVEGD